jgi:hypothetical protein
MKPNLINTEAVNNAYKNILKIKKKNYRSLSFNINVFLICIILVFLYVMYRRFYEKKEKVNLIIHSKNLLKKEEIKKQEITQRHNNNNSDLFYNEYKLNI